MYKLICEICHTPVTVTVGITGKYGYVGCKCDREILDMRSGWKIEASGKLPKEELLKYCTGCYENIYNGNNTIGVKECWNLKSAKLVTKKKVGINDEPPWNHTPIKCLSCYHETGYVMIDSSVK